MQDNRQKKTSCPSKMSVIVKVPTKKECRLESYFVSHPTVVQVTFNHNHPLGSAHALSFRPIAPETKEIFYELFRKGHTHLLLTTGMKLSFFLMEVKTRFYWQIELSILQSQI
jgi:hypothetical protein